MNGKIIGFENGIKVSYEYDFDKTIRGEALKEIKSFNLYDRVRGFYQHQVRDLEPLFVTGFIEKVENNQIKNINLQFKFGTFIRISDFENNDEKFKEYSNEMLNFVKKHGIEVCVRNGIIYPITLRNGSFMSSVGVFNFDVSPPSEEGLFQVERVDPKDSTFLQSGEISFKLTEYIPLIEKTIIASYEKMSL